MTSNCENLQGSSSLEDALVREGRLMPRSSHGCPTVTVAKIDMDVLFRALSSNLKRVFKYHEPLRRKCGGSLDDSTMVDVNATIDRGIFHYCHQAMNELWNRLQDVGWTYVHGTKDSVFFSLQNRAVSLYGFEVPQFYASLLSGIGPLHISDAFHETIVVYAPEQCQPFFGRSEDPEIDVDQVLQFMDALRSIDIPLKKIETWGSSKGSYFTTCGRVATHPQFFDVLGAFPPNNYSQDDVVMAMLFGDFNTDDNPFEDLSISVGYVSDEATVQAFVATRDPALKGETASGLSRHVGGTYGINYFGLARSSEAFGGHQSSRRGIYILGRGFERHYAALLARGISNFEFILILRDRMLHGSRKVSLA